jgi:hypothetical protein
VKGTRETAGGFLRILRTLRLDEGVHSVIMAPVGAHSQKPDEAYARMERLFGGPYLELFARRPRAGWTTWGDESRTALRWCRRLRRLAQRLLPRCPRSRRRRRGRMDSWRRVSVAPNLQNALRSQTLGRVKVENSFTEPAQRLRERICTWPTVCPSHLS